MAFYAKWFSLIFITTLFSMAMIDAGTRCQEGDRMNRSLGTPSADAPKPARNGE